MKIKMKRSLHISFFLCCLLLAGQAGWAVFPPELLKRRMEDKQLLERAEMGLNLLRPTTRTMAMETNPHSHIAAHPRDSGKAGPGRYSWEAHSRPLLKIVVFAA